MYIFCFHFISFESLSLNLHLPCNARIKILIARYIGRVFILHSGFLFFLNMRDKAIYAGADVDGRMARSVLSLLPSANRKFMFVSDNEHA